MSVIDAVESADGLKGVVVDVYSTYADENLAECIRQFKVDVDSPR